MSCICLHAPVRRLVNLRRALLVSLLAAVSLGLRPTASPANSYDVVACDAAPAGAQNAWQQFTTDSRWQTVSLCPTDGVIQRGLKLVNPGNTVSPYSAAGWVLAAPPSTSINSVTFAIKSEIPQTDPSPYRFSIENQTAVMAECGGVLAHCGDGGNICCSTVATPGSSAVKFQLQCAQANVCTTPGSVEFARLTANIEDDVPPTLALVGGGVAADGPLSGSQTALVDATDAGSGIARVRLLVDGVGVVDKRNPGCDFTRARPCGDWSALGLSVDTRALSDGSHALHIEARDAADNATGLDRTIVVDNHPRVASIPPSADAPAPAPGLASRAPSRLSVTAGHRSRCATRARRSRRRQRCRRPASSASGLTISHGAATSVSGQLTTAAGSPIGGAAIDVLEQVGDSPGWRALATTRTDGRGRISYRLGAGPSRRIVFAFAGTDGAGPASASLALKVPARTSIRVDHHTVALHQPFTIRGRLSGGYVPPAGVIVCVYARDNGRWRPAGAVSTDRTGRWRLRTSVNGGFGVVDYPLEAVIKRQQAYPFAPATIRGSSIQVVGH